MCFLFSISNICRHSRHLEKRNVLNLGKSNVVLFFQNTAEEKNKIKRDDYHRLMDNQTRGTNELSKRSIYFGDLVV